MPFVSEQHEFMPKNNPHSLATTCELVYVPQAAEPLRFYRPWTEGLTVRQLLQDSGFLQTNPYLAEFSVGVFARLVDFDTKIQPGDRVELYRPLLRDPKEQRRQQAKLKRTT